MGFMLEFISKYGTVAIVLFGIAVAALLLWNGGRAFQSEEPH